MSLKISRETIGDIRVGDGAAYVFLTETAANDAFNSISKVGSEGVKISRGFDSEKIPKREFKEIKGSVSSLRVDCVVSLAAGCSRTVAEQLVSSGNVSVHGKALLNGAKKLCEGDVFSVRGSGKFILENIGGSTKKGRTFIELKKFI
jgi:RNA-binding protein YlmH